LQGLSYHGIENESTFFSSKRPYTERILMSDSEKVALSNSEDKALLIFSRLISSKAIFQHSVSVATP